MSNVSRALKKVKNALKRATRHTLILKHEGIKTSKIEKELKEAWTEYNLLEEYLYNGGHE